MRKKNKSWRKTGDTTGVHGAVGYFGKYPRSLSSLELQSFPWIFLRQRWQSPENVCGLHTSKVILSERSLDGDIVHRNLYCIPRWNKRTQNKDCDKRQCLFRHGNQHFNKLVQNVQSFCGHALLCLIKQKTRWKKCSREWWRKGAFQCDKWTNTNRWVIWQWNDWKTYLHISNQIALLQ